MTRIAITTAPIELVLISARQLHLLAKILDPDFEVHLETPGLVMASSTGVGEPNIERYYVRTVHALLAQDLVVTKQRGSTLYFEAAADVLAALS